MPPLDSTATYEDVVAAYADNSDYRTTPSKVDDFIQACTLLLQYAPRRASESGSEVETNPAEIRRERDLALKFAAKQDAGGRRTYVDLSAFRD